MSFRSRFYPWYQEGWKKPSGVELDFLQLQEIASKLRIVGQPLTFRGLTVPMTAWAPHHRSLCVSCGCTGWPCMCGKGGIAGSR